MSKKIFWPMYHNRIRRGLVNHTFGRVRRNADGSLRTHQGWDFAAAIGTPCFAVADGVVEDVVSRGDYGLQVLLRFQFDIDDNGKPDTVWAFYAHLSRADVKAGQTVTKGQKIGLTGDSGNAKGMKPADQHLHFELRTIPHPGRGEAGRLSPIEIFGRCPLDAAIIQFENVA